MPRSQSAHNKDAISERFIYLIHRAQNVSTGIISRNLADMSLTGSLGLILEVLANEGELSAANLARRCQFSRQAMVSPLNQLEAMGLVTRPDATHSARVRPIALTEAGKTVAAEINRRVNGLETRALESFNDAERLVLKDLLRRYAESWAHLESGSAPATEAIR